MDAEQVCKFHAPWWVQQSALSRFFNPRISQLSQHRLYGATGKHCRDHRETQYAQIVARRDIAVSALA